MTDRRRYEDLFAQASAAEADLVLLNASPLGDAAPPRQQGVYALFHRGLLRYIGEATGRNGLYNRRRNYVSGDDGHTTHRVFRADFPVKADRRAHIETNVLMAWRVVDDPLLAKALERVLIWRFNPEWNRV